MKRLVLFAVCVGAVGCDEAIVRIAVDGGSDAGVCSSAAPGTACGPGKVCDGTGTCIDCAGGTACTSNPNAPCKVGKTTCEHGKSECLDDVNAVAGTTCPDGVCNSSGLCVPCVTGMSCATNPGGACLRGKLSCATGGPVCADDAPLDAGVSCAQDKVCNGTGSCITCAQGAACTSNSAQPCVTGKTECGSGAPVCTNSAPASAGGSCGTNLVCDGDGGCSTCTPGATCSTNPGGSCVNGALACSNGVTCNDGTPKSAGVSCGTNQVCNGAGACVACTADSACSGNPSACRVGAIACGTGAPVCVDAAPSAAGLSCGMNLVCDGDGGCASCTVGSACAGNPGGVCVRGVRACASGVACVDGPAVDAGASCGTNQVCSGAGACVSCTQSQTCSNNPAAPCKTGSIACGSGAPVCVDTGNAGPGLSCGMNLVCTGDGGCVSCQAGQACLPTVNPCIGGSVVCTSGAPVCTTTGPKDDGTTCPSGACTQGVCTPSVTAPAGTTNLMTASLVGRSCADEFVASVTALTSTTATLSAAPAAGCLAAGDEVMLLTLQGTQAAHDTVGTYELLTLASNVTTTTATFTTPKTRFYGAATTNDSNLGTGASNIRVVLIRVPRYGNLTVPAGSTLTVSEWGGVTGGVLALRAASVSVAGEIKASGLGYRQGSNSIDSNCTTNPDIPAGESIGGLGAAGSAANLGGSGGTTAASGAFGGNDYIPSSAGHADAGEQGKSSAGRTPGPPGIAYGLADGGTLTFGSGAGGGFTCPGSGFYTGLPEGGGIIAIFGGGSISVTGSGKISANATSLHGSSGGQILLRALSVSTGAFGVSAIGAQGVHSTAEFRTGSPGYVTIYYRDALTGTTAPAAFSQAVPNP